MKTKLFAVLLIVFLLAGNAAAAETGKNAGTQYLIRKYQRYESVLLDDMEGTVQISYGDEESNFYMYGGQTGVVIEGSEEKTGFSDSIFPRIQILHLDEEDEHHRFVIYMQCVVKKKPMGFNQCIFKIGDKRFRFESLPVISKYTESLDSYSETAEISTLADDIEELMDTLLTANEENTPVKLRMEGQDGYFDFDITKNVYYLAALWEDYKKAYMSGLTPEELEAELGEPLEQEELSAEETAYREALSLENEGKYSEAVARYQSVPEYKDAAERINICIKAGIQQLLDRGKIKSALEELEPYREEEWAEPLYRLCRFRMANYVEITFSGTLWVQYESKGPYQVLAGDGTVLSDLLEGNRNAYDDYGNRIVRDGFDTCSRFSYGHAVVTRGSSQVLVDTQGNETELSPKVKYGYPVSETLITYEDSKGNKGAADADGKIVIKAAYKYISGTDCDLLEVTDPNGHQGILDLKGEKIVSPGKYEICKVLSEDLFYVAKYDKKADRYLGGFINRKGKELAGTGSFEGPWAGKNGELILAKKETGYGVTDPDFNTVLPFSFSDRTGSADGSRFGLLKDGKWTIYGSDGTSLTGGTEGTKILIPPAGLNWFVIRNSTGYYIMDFSGNLIY